MTDYFKRKEVSNSDLSSLDKYLRNDIQAEPLEAYAFGTLIDAMITEPDRIDWLRFTIDGELAPNFFKAKKMMESFQNNDKAQAIIKGADFQKISIKRRSIEYKGYTFEMDCRCKWDWFNSTSISGDIKSTTAKTQKQFEAACIHFSYPRSRAWYMDLEGTNKDMIIGISKKNYKIFFVPIVRGGELYELGKAEYSRLAYKWHVLCPDRAELKNRD